ncbi:MAG: acyl-CoA dehydrogenase [Pseudomonadales bacterium]
MNDYTAPVKDIMFTLTDMIGIEDLATTPGCEEMTVDLLESIFSEGGKLVSGLIAPVNHQADQEGIRFADGKVQYPQVLVDAWRAFAEGGWAGLAIPAEYGGQGMGQTAYCPFHEMLCAGSLAFVQCPGLTVGAVEALLEHGTEKMRTLYFPKMASGEWTGTMNLTEPQAGSDVGALRSKAIPQADGSYKIIGQKIFITCGEQDFSENIVHLVLARIEGAPGGSRGISLFLVPKIIPNEDGSLGEANDLRCTGVEHKMGLHGSSACSMSYGGSDDKRGGATGWLIGEENKGLACMFTMMNIARLHVGLHGTGCAERAYQMALAYAHERVQGVPVGSADGQAAAIIHHADVRRMLLTMRAKIAASRAICYLNAKAIDLAGALPTGSDDQKYWQGLSDVLTPLSKAYSSDIGVEVSSDAVQVFGGMGFIEEAGVAQIYRDVRISPIYEGTNGIQAWDLANRKLKMDGGAHWRALLTDIDDFAASLQGALTATGQQLAAASAACRETGEWFLQRHSDNGSRDVAAGSVAYQRLLSETVGAWLLARGAQRAQQRLDSSDNDTDFLRSKINLARFFAERLLPSTIALAGVAQNGDELLFADAEHALQSA